MSKIICPYCFAEFEDNEVIFRANTGFDAGEIDGGMGTPMGFGAFGGMLGGQDSQESKEQDSDIEVKRLFRKFDKANSMTATKKMDEKLIKYWEKRGGESGYIQYDKHWDFPHIDPKDLESFAQMVSYEEHNGKKPDSDGLIRDSDGFVMRVFDRYSDPLEPMTRLCRECHNPLPTDDYGKYPVKFISIIGITSAGKTVFLNQLLTKFASVLQGTGFYRGANNLNSLGETVSPGFALPASTDDKTMRRPLAVTLLRNDPRGDEPKGETLVFYDIAGENCVTKDGNMDEARALATIGQFIAKSDGMIFLLDPEQVPVFARRHSAPVNISNVVDVITNIRTAQTGENWENVPVAVCMAKSDTVNNNSMVTQNEDLRLILQPSRANIRGFDREENIRISRSLQALFQEHAETAVMAPLSPFSQRAFFAVSAITCGVESRFEKYQNQYILDTENERRFRALHDWVVDWNERTQENREMHFRPCPVRTRDGGQITIPSTQSITEKNSSQIETEIFATDEYNNEVYLSLGDSLGLNLVGYPVADPSPRRVGDPLKWILWQLGQIGPDFIETGARPRRFLESNARYNEYLEQLRIDNNNERIRFYDLCID